MTEKDEIKIPIFSGKNYSRWRYKILLHLQVKECKAVIDQEEPPENTTAAAWSKLDAKARDFIVNLVSDEIFDLIVSEPSAREIIAKLDRLYRSESTANKVQVRKELLELKLRDSEDPDSFFLEFEKRSNDLRNTGATFNEEEKLATLLSALPESYSHLCDIIDSITTDKFEFIKTKILLNYKKSNGESSSSESSHSSNAFHSSRKYHYNQRYRSRSRDRKFSHNCNRYNRSYRSNSRSRSRSKSHSPHHYKSKNNQRCSKECNHSHYRNSSPDSDDEFKSNNYNFKRKSSHRNRNYQSSPYPSNHKNSKNHKRHQHSNDSYHKRSFNANCGNLHFESNNDEVNQIDFKHSNLSDVKYYANFSCVTNSPNSILLTNYALNNSCLPKSGTIDWLIDSGCSDHIVNSDKYFTNVQNLKEPIKIGLGDGSPLISMLKGTINVKYQVGNKWFPVTIYDVFYVPDMTNNLLSVSKITDKGNYFKFTNNQGNMYTSDHELFGIAYRHGNLYKLTSKVNPETVSVVANNLEKGCMTAKEEWHRKTGHMSFPNLSKLISKNGALGLPHKLNNENLQCEICLENKMANLPFKNVRCVEVVVALSL